MNYIEKGLSGKISIPKLILRDYVLILGFLYLFLQDFFLRLGIFEQPILLIITMLRVTVLYFVWCRSLYISIVKRIALWFFILPIFVVHLTDFFLITKYILQVPIKDWNNKPLLLVSKPEIKNENIPS